jgi:hypothetical protein
VMASVPPLLPRMPSLVLTTPCHRRYECMIRSSSFARMVSVCWFPFDHSYCFVSFFHMVLKPRYSHSMVIMIHNNSVM